MISSKDFYDIFYELGIDFFTGVPDKKLENFIINIVASQSSYYVAKSGKSNYRKSSIQIVPAAREDNAISIASGYHFATGKCPLVYMSNSGLWSSINPLFTLADKNAFSIPMIILMALEKDDANPYNKKNILLTEDFIKNAGYDLCKITADSNFFDEIKNIYQKAIDNSAPVFILVDTDVSNSKTEYKNKKYSALSKLETLDFLLSFISKDDIIVSSSGNVSNILLKLNETKKDNGTMLNIIAAHGQASSVAYGIALNTTKNVWCIDGDGSFLHDLGGLTAAIQNTQKNLKYILIDDGSYSSTGGQDTPIRGLDTKKMLKSMGFKNTIEAHCIEDVKVGLLRLAKEKSVMIVKVYDNNIFEKNRLKDPAMVKQDVMRLLQKSYAK